MGQDAKNGMGAGPTSQMQPGYGGGNWLQRLGAGINAGPQRNMGSYTNTMMPMGGASWMGGTPNVANLVGQAGALQNNIGSVMNAPMGATGGPDITSLVRGVGNMQNAQQGVMNGGPGRNSSK